MLVLLLLAQAAAPPAEPEPHLHHDRALAAVSACVADARTRGRALAVIATDLHGAIVSAARMDRAPTKALEIAQLKAGTAAGLPYTPDELRPVVFQDPDRPHGIERVPGVVIFDGAARLVTPSGVKVGAIGVSGATAAEDRACADIGAAAFRRSFDRP